MAAIETGAAEGFLCATTITTIHYIAAKALGEKIARNHINALLQIFQIAPVTQEVLSAALNSKINGFEDAVLFESARAVSVNVIVTRNLSDFTKASDILLYTPDIARKLISKVSFGE